MVFVLQGYLSQQRHHVGQFPIYSLHLKQRELESDAFFNHWTSSYQTQRCQWTFPHNKQQNCLKEKYSHVTNDVCIYKERWYTV